MADNELEEFLNYCRSRDFLSEAHEFYSDGLDCGTLGYYFFKFKNQNLYLSVHRDRKEMWLWKYKGEYRSNPVEISFAEVMQLISKNKEIINFFLFNVQWMTDS